MDTAHRTVRESPTGDPPGYAHPEWLERFPWLVQGTTARGVGPEPYDLGLFSGASPEADVRGRWTELMRATGMGAAAHAPQLHRARVRFHRRDRPGLRVAGSCDGHATTDVDLLLAVTVADCVPVSVVDPQRRGVAMVHAGWRGAAAHILEVGLAVLGERTGARMDRLHVHLGPAICGACYEVGPEVFRALGVEEPAAPTPIDLRAWLAARAIDAGVPAEQVTASELCTLCGDAGLFSHRGGDGARQVGYLGVRP